MAGRVTVGRILQSAVDSVKSVLRSGAKGSTPEADVTSTAINADRQALDVAIKQNERSSVAVRTSVGVSATDVQLLAANTSRLGATFYNDADAALLIGLGAAAVDTDSFTVLVPAQTLWVLTEDFTGEIRGAWETDSSGSVRITEMTP